MNRGRRAALKQRKGWKAMAEDSPADRAAGQLSRQRASLLDAALRHVPFDGWTWTALDAGARDLSLAPGEVLRLFPGGPQELIRAFSAAGDRRMLEALEEIGRAHVCTPVTNAQLVCRLLLEKKK